VYTYIIYYCYLVLNENHEDNIISIVCSANNNPAFIWAELSAAFFVFSSKVISLKRRFQFY
ncbi:MAG: hypothetical protein MJZ16_12735, partial [Bacteroidales bacterium]|nr:hypothetical protein [Bacteroidales bacterium]